MLTSIVLLFLALPPSPNAAIAIELELLDSMTRHDAYAPLRGAKIDGGKATITITAAGREKESTQLLLRSPTNRTVRVVVTPPAVLPEGAVRAERLGFVWATNKTSDPAQSRTFPMRCPEAELRRRGGCWVAAARCDFCT